MNSINNNGTHREYRELKRYNATQRRYGYGIMERCPTSERCLRECVFRREIPHQM